jgi:hypothetical protein
MKTHSLLNLKPCSEDVLGSGGIAQRIFNLVTGRDYSENLGVDRKIILKWIVGREMWTGCI